MSYPTTALEIIRGGLDLIDEGQNAVVVGLRELKLVPNEDCWIDTSRMWDQILDEHERRSKKKRKRKT